MKIYEKIITDLLVELDVDYSKYKRLNAELLERDIDKDAERVYKIKTSLCKTILERIKREEWKENMKKQ